MRLTGIDCQVPSSKIHNEDIIELIKYYSSPVYNGEIAELETFTRKFLKITGIETRFWRAQNEKPIDIIISCFERAISMAGIKNSDIDLLIYAGIDRAFIEPANANFICKALSLKDTRSFDIVDACMGWASAVQTANSFIDSSSTIKTVAIVNAEFPMDKKGSVLPRNFTINNMKELEWKSPSFTLGEGASVCIFQKDDSTDCVYEFIENSEAVEFCTIALQNFDKFIDSTFTGISNEELQFYAFGSQLLASGMQPAVDVLHALIRKLGAEPKIIFPHSVSNKVIQNAFRNSEVHCNIFSTVKHLGNLATVSVPSSIAKAFLNGIVHSGDRCVAWIASAGMKFSAFEIQL